MRRVGYIYDPRYLDHLTGPSHPERPRRVEAVDQRVRESGLARDLVRLETRAAAVEWIREVHDFAYVARVQETCGRGDLIIDSMDTGISERSFEIALLAAGAGLVAADSVMNRDVEAVFASVRPPGHHALRDTAMGFCLFNSAAVVARYLQKEHGLEKIFILDWDVHHGNGTQAAFYDDPSVFYFSIHQFPFYPGTGAEGEAGEGAGEGFTLNAPMPAGCTDDQYRKAFDEKLVPALQSFSPDAVIISAGFDAHRDDPLAGMQLTEEGFAALTRTVLDTTAAICPGRLISLLEGGYDLHALAASAESHIRTLAGSE
jgi:acetoin utilization deacetylase AcuC-like enzyme